MHFIELTISSLLVYQQLLQGTSCIECITQGQHSTARTMTQINQQELSHRGRGTHICVSKLTIIGSDNGLSPGRRQAIIWNNAGLLLIESLGTNSSEIAIGIQSFSFKKMHLNMSSAKWRPSCLGLNVLMFNMQGRLGQVVSPRGDHGEYSFGH